MGRGIGGPETQPVANMEFLRMIHSQHTSRPRGVYHPGDRTHSISPVNSSARFVRNQQKTP